MSADTYADFYLNKHYMYTDYLLKRIVPHFGNCTHLLSCLKLDENTLVCRPMKLHTAAG